MAKTSADSPRWEGKRTLRTDRRCKIPLWKCTQDCTFWKDFRLSRVFTRNNPVVQAIIRGVIRRHACLPTDIAAQISPCKKRHRHGNRCRPKVRQREFSKGTEQRCQPTQTFRFRVTSVRGNSVIEIPADRWSNSARARPWKRRHWNTGAVFDTAD